MCVHLNPDIKTEIENSIKKLIGNSYSYNACYVFLRQQFPPLHDLQTEIVMLYIEQSEIKVFTRRYNFKMINKMGVEEIALMFFIEFVFGVRGGSYTVPGQVWYNNSLSIAELL